MLKSTRLVGACGKFTHRKVPSTRLKYTCTSTYHPACQLGGNFATPLPSDSPCLVWQGRVLVFTMRATRCGSSKNSEPTYSFVQVLANTYVPCCRVGGSRGGGGWWWLCRLYTFWCSILSSLASEASSSTCEMCLRFRGCPVVLEIELSASTRYHRTRVLLLTRRVLFLSCTIERRCAA